MAERTWSGLPSPAPAAEASRDPKPHALALVGSHVRKDPGTVKARLDEVARLAGVGIATVDRVLNERGNVSPATAKKVIDAARTLGVRRTLPSPYRRGLRFEVILGRRTDPFFVRLSAEFGRKMEALARDVVIQRTFVDERDATRVANAVRRSRANAIILYAQDHAAILDAVAAVTSAGVPVITLSSDLPTSPRLAYVGIDHYRAGRSAAFFVAGMGPADGSALVCYGSLSYRSEAERVSGFRDGMREYGGPACDVRLIDGSDDVQRTKEGLAKSFRDGNVRGIYDAGNNSAGVAAFLQGSQHQGKTIFVGHGLTDNVRSLLNAGVMTLAIDQNPVEQARRTLDILLSRFGVSAPLPISGVVPFTLHTQDNTDVDDRD